YAREMVPAFNAYFYFKVGLYAARRFVRMFYRVRLGHMDTAIMDNVPDNTAIVFFINHRSNIDYLLVTYLASKSAALSYGAGEWARIWPFRSLLRFAGAYILRRDASDPLYRKILERYVQMATESCVPHAIFAEGQLSRDGKVHRPKLGMLGYITKKFDRNSNYDIVFIPVATNFDRVFEERTLIVNRDTDFRGRGPIFVLGSTMVFLWSQIWRKIRGRWQGFGIASAGFGEPLSLRAWSKQHRVNFSSTTKENRFRKVQKLADDLMVRIASVIPVLAVPLISAILLKTDAPVGENELAQQAYDLMMEMRDAGAHISLLKGQEMAEIRQGISSMAGRNLIIRDASGKLAPEPNEIPLLEFYANSIAHLQPGQKWDYPA
ncbi:MAG: 1-acyl-sn-glycerol-3-phosphate acyltransferase, partial [Fimbriimonadaceae bacterium]|nr:1-acyl-sn-glycerol-3-phosphate acyltransferase [Alphaproteobacteria bacterium]